MVLGVMGAMAEEIDALVGELGPPASRVSAGGRDYHLGTLWGVPAVLAFSRWGKVAAATTATTLIARFGIGELVFTGVAGAADPRLAIGDVVVATALYQHDMDARPLFPRHEIPLLGVGRFETSEPLRAALVRAAGAFLAEDYARAVPAAVRDEFRLAAPKVVAADVATGDKFVAERAEVLALKERLPAVGCVEMEGAAVAQVCHEHGVPFAVVRTISDGADEAAAVNFPRFVAGVARAYSHGILERLLTSRTAPA
jgi:adenosylhomocysteine nucleosidase